MVPRQICAALFRARWQGFWIEVCKGLSPNLLLGFFILVLSDIDKLEAGGVAFGASADGAVPSGVMPRDAD